MHKAAHRKTSRARAAMIGFATAAALLSWQLLSAQPADAASVERGRRLARIHCARCHAIGKVGSSSLPLAPPFRKLHERYPVETLQEALAEGIVTGHPSMPEFRFDPDQIGDLLAFLKSLE